MTNDPTSAAYEDLHQEVFRYLNCYEIEASVIHDGKTYIDSGEAEQITGDIMRVFKQAIAEAYEQGKNAGHAAQHAKDFDELAEAEAYQVKAIAEAETRGRLQTALDFATRLKDEFMRRELSSDTMPKGYRKMTNEELITKVWASLQANADGANGRDGEVTNNG